MEISFMETFHDSVFFFFCVEYNVRQGLKDENSPRLFGDAKNGYLSLMGQVNMNCHRI